MKEVRLDLSSNLLAVELINSHAIYSDYKWIYESVTPSVIFVNDRTGIPVFHYSQVGKINVASSPVIIIDLLTECSNVCYKFNEYRTDRTYIFISNGTWEKARYKFDFEYEIVTEYYFLKEWANKLTCTKSINYYVDRAHTPASVEYLFCAMIGTARPIRDILVDKIVKSVTSEYSLSYAGQQIKGSRNFDINYDFNNYDSYASTNTTAHFNISESIPVNLFNVCQFNLVVETCIDLPAEFHLTEKTLKAIASGMPFVIAAGPYFLKNLHQLGFRTFDELWSEEYDIIDDTSTRIDTVVALINELSMFDWDANRSKILEITNYNRLHLAYGCAPLLKETFTQLENALGCYAI